MPKKFILEENEQILETARGDFWRFSLIENMNQVSGKFIFTNKRINFTSIGLIKVIFDIPYENIEYIEPFRVVFFNTGIRVFEKDKTSGCRLSVRKRDKYINLINNQIAKYR